MSRHPFRRTLALCSLALLPACAGSGPAPAEPADDLSRLQQDIFNVHCLSAGCHNSQARAGNLVLADGLSFDQLVGRPPDNPAARAASLQRVAPFEPARSFLLIKLTEPGEGQGSRMPLGAPPLSPAQLGAVQSWISGGAPRGPLSTPTFTATPEPIPTVPSPPATPTPSRFGPASEPEGVGK